MSVVGSSGWRASSSLPHRQVTIAGALLLAADGLANEVARRTGVRPDTVGGWRKRFEAHWVEGADRWS
jgi:hypothetical protein